MKFHKMDKQFVFCTKTQYFGQISMIVLRLGIVTGIVFAIIITIAKQKSHTQHTLQEPTATLCDINDYH